MQHLDWGIVAGYFALLLCITWWVVLKNQDTSADYFLAGHSLGWFIVGASIFASNIGSEHLVGLAGSGTSDGVAMAHYELHAWLSASIGLGDGAVLRTLRRIHDARIPGTAFLTYFALRAVDYLTGGLCRDENSGRYFRGRHCVFRIAPGHETCRTR